LKTAWLLLTDTEVVPERVAPELMVAETLVAEQLVNVMVTGLDEVDAPDAMDRVEDETARLPAKAAGAEASTPTITRAAEASGTTRRRVSLVSAHMVTSRSSNHRPP